MQGLFLRGPLAWATTVPPNRVTAGIASGSKGLQGCRGRGERDKGSEGCKGQPWKAAAGIAQHRCPRQLPPLMQEACLDSSGCSSSRYGTLRIGTASPVSMFSSTTHSPWRVQESGRGVGGQLGEGTSKKERGSGGDEEKGWLGGRRSAGSCSCLSPISPAAAPGHREACQCQPPPGPRAPDLGRTPAPCPLASGPRPTRQSGRGWPGGGG